jgi:hypothetical protein
MRDERIHDCWTSKDMAGVSGEWWSAGFPAIYQCYQ